MADKANSAPVHHAPVQIEWIGGLRFETGRPDGAKVRIDGDAKSAPSPFDLLLAALASCAATDVVTILEKQRTPAQALRVRVEATRIDGTPRRLAAAVLHFQITAPGLTRERAERAVELSVNKYCSVRSSLASNVSVTWMIELQS